MKNNKVLNSVCQSVVDKINVALSGGQENAVIVNLSIGEINSMRVSGLTDSSVAYQRGLQSAWLKPDFRGRVLDSIVRGWSVGMIHAILRKDNTIEFIDGKQRLHFIGLTMDGIGLFEGVEFDDSLNRSFLEWPEENKLKFTSFKIPFTFYPSAIDDTERHLIFSRLNAGIQVSPIQRRRGEILSIISRPQFRNSALKIHEYVSLFKVAGKIPSFENTENIILQVLSYLSVGNCDYTGEIVIDSLKSSSVKNLHNGLDALENNVKAFSGMFDGWLDNPDALKSVKWLCNKSALNSLLCVFPDDSGIYNPLYFGSFKKSRNDKESGADQLDYKSFCSSGSASDTAVRGRIEIMRKIVLGTFTRNICKDNQTLEVVATDRQLKDNQTLEVVATDRQLKVFADAWGDEFATPSLINLVVSKVKELGGSSAYPVKNKISNGNKEVDYIINGKHYYKELAEVTGLKVND